MLTPLPWVLCLVTLAIMSFYVIPSFAVVSSWVSMARIFFLKFFFSFIISLNVYVLERAAVFLVLVVIFVVLFIAKPLHLQYAVSKKCYVFSQGTCSVAANVFSKHIHCACFTPM